MKNVSIIKLLFQFIKYFMSEQYIVGTWLFFDDNFSLGPKTDFFPFSISSKNQSDRPWSLNLTETSLLRVSQFSNRVNSQYCMCRCWFNPYSVAGFCRCPLALPTYCWIWSQLHTSCINTPIIKWKGCRYHLFKYLEPINSQSTWLLKQSIINVLFQWPLNLKWFN